MSSAHPSLVVLCLNSGSSSLKFALFATSGTSEERLATGAVEHVGEAGARAWVRAGDAGFEKSASTPDHASALNVAFELLDAARAPGASAVGHRVVHGGPRYFEPTRVDDAVLADLRALVPIAPLHLPPAIAGIEAVRGRSPELPQFACFDTAFHRGMPELAKRLPLPKRLYDDGIRRYGFHGLSYEYVVATLGAALPPRAVIAHLGSGASLVAVRDGRAVDTTMGFTPAGGIPMGTRSGDLDPGLLVYLAREKGYSPDALERLVERESGLVALGGTADVEELLERARTEEQARFALSTFGYSVRKAIGAFAAALGGIDLLVFTGGIGEHAAEIRAEACRGLECLGIALDPEKNASGAAVVSSRESACTVRVLSTDEDLVIARHVRAVMAAKR